MKKILFALFFAAAAAAVVFLSVRPLKCTANTPGESTPAVSAGEWRSVAPAEITDNAYSLFNDDWMALAVGSEGDMNAMTISWGSIGSLWGRPVVTVYVSPDRYTHGFMERNDHFTVTAFPESEKQKLVYIGSHSGRDGDKIKDAGLTVEYTALGNPTFTDGRLMIECKKIYGGQFAPSKFGSEAEAIYRSGMGVHYMYIGEIVNVWVK